MKISKLLEDNNIIAGNTITERDITRFKNELYIDIAKIISKALDEQSNQIASVHEQVLEYLERK